MKGKQKKSICKTISATLAATMLSSICAAFPVYAEIGTRTYEYDRFNVTYTVTNEWSGNQNVTVALTNTSNEPILNWALGYSAGGEISGIWNGSVYSCSSDSDNYIIKNAGYNYEIAPDQSVNFGYTLSGDKITAPDRFELCSKRVDVTEGYDMQCNYTQIWNTGVQGEIIISNTSKLPIEAWTLSFDADFSINNLWNGRIIEGDGDSYIIASEAWTNPIQPESSMTIGFVGTKTPDAEAQISNFKLTKVIIDSENPIEPSEPTEPTDPDDPNEPDIDWGNETDSDNDSLPDVYEINYFETDPENPDTDGDGLPDGYEAFYLGTDPKKADSDDNGISDADEDFDDDGLNNIREYELGTDPTDADSDGDGLTDSDEINIYNTDPLKYDTDGDGISDSDEISLELDPNNPATDGTPDSERTFSFHIDADSENFSAINTEENPFKISVDITAAGSAENNLSARESGYSYSMKNAAILGVSPELTYTEGLKVEDVVINFYIADSAVSNTNGSFAAISDEFVGIKRLNVFKYFEDTNMLLPVETFHDVENNRVYTHVDELGTYCLMDMEVWLESIGIEAVGSEYNEVDVEKTAAYASEINTRPADIVFIMQEEGDHTEAAFNVMKTAADCSAELLFNKMNNIRISIIIGSSSGGRYAETASGSRWAENSKEVTEMLAQMKYKHIDEYLKYISAPLMVRSRNDYREDAQRFAVLFHWAHYDDDIRVNLWSTESALDRIKDDPLFNYSRVNCGEWFYVPRKNAIPMDGEYHRNKVAEFESHGGVYINGLTDPNKMAERVSEHISGFKPDLPEEYTIIKANSLEQLPVDFGKIYPESTADYDKDRLKDSEEINFEFIRYENGNYKLPTFEECRKKFGEKFYVVSGLDRLKSTSNYLLSKIDEMIVLTINSDPTCNDSDGDGIMDVEEETWNGLDVRYSGISPLRIDTVETLYPELKLDSKNGLNKSSNPVYLEIDGNNININVRVSLTDDSGDLTGRSTIYNALDKYWIKNFEGTENDFYKGMKIRSNIIVHEKKSIFERAVNIHFEKTANHEKRSYVFNKQKMCIYYYDDIFSELPTIAHEFGHCFGINDAYGLNAFIGSGTNKGYEILETPIVGLDTHEICSNTEIMLCKSNPEVSLNNIEMILQFFLDGKMQSFVSIGEQKLSAAIKTDKLYYFSCKNMKIYRYERTTNNFIEVSWAEIVPDSNIINESEIYVDTLDWISAENFSRMILGFADEVDYEINDINDFKNFLNITGVGSLWLETKLKK